MALADDFEAAVAASRNLPKQGNESLLQLYALFKQGKNGDASGKRPKMFDPVGRAKYDAWAKLAGTSKEDAMQQYVDLVNKLGS